MPPWSDFTQDPRTLQAAALRASDQDRQVAGSVLAEAFADGRLDRDEYDERVDALPGTKTLGGLADLILDLVPQHPTPAQRRELAAAEAAQRQAHAVQRWESQRRQRLVGFLVPTLICWAIWLAASTGPNGFGADFPWPLFVMLGTGMGLIQVLSHKQAIIASELERLERKHRKSLESRQRPDPSAG